MYAECVYAPGDIAEVRRLPSGRSSWHTAESLAGLADTLRRENRAGQNIYVGANPRRAVGQSGDGSVTLARCIFADFDDLAVEDAVARIADAKLPTPTLTIASGHGAHAYWRFDEPFADLTEWRRIQRDLIALLNSDNKIHNPERIMRLPGYRNHKPPVAECGVVDAVPSRVYAWADVMPLIPRRATTEKKSASTTGERIAEGGRNATLTSLAGSMRHRGMSHDAILAALRAENAAKCSPPLDDAEVEAIARSVSRYEPATPRQWPDPLTDAAYHGLAGQIVHAIEPHTEADAAALLIQLLVYYGNAIGRHAHFVADGARHHANLFAVLVGETSKGRKGTSAAQVIRPFHAASPTWTNTRIVEGLSSGEGLIWAVRDPITKHDPIKTKGMVTGYQEIEVDPGIDDKRLLVQEGEFAQCLKVIRREGNTLSPVIRRAWDGGGTLSTLTKNSPATATDAHISIVGHITRDELVRLMQETEGVNGFANRFLWICVRRSKCLPFGGTIEAVDFTPMNLALAEAIEYGQVDRLIPLHRESRDEWERVYPHLSGDTPGMAGAVTARAEAQVLRLAMIYALLDQTAWIMPAHLAAALAIWRYVEASARYIFGRGGSESSEDRHRRELIEFVIARGGQVTVRDLTHGLRRYRDDAEQAEADLDRLAAAKLGRWETSPQNPRGGRQSRIFRVTEAVTDVTVTITPAGDSATGGIGDGDGAEAHDEYARQEREAMQEEGA